MKRVSNLDMTQCEIQNYVIQNLAQAPTNPPPKKGQKYFNTQTNREYTYNGTKWVPNDADDAMMTGGDIVTQINGQASQINLANVDMSGYVEDSLTSESTVNPLSANQGKALNTKIEGLDNADIGLGNVTNHRQIQAPAASTNGMIPIWDGVLGEKLVNGYSVETTLSNSTTSVPRSDAVKKYVDDGLATAEAMTYMGTLGTGGTVSELPNTHRRGDTYKVVTAGTYKDHVCEVGDMIIAVTDRDTDTTISTDWTVVQTNIDGAVVNTTDSSTVGNFVEYADANGKVIKDSGKKAADFAPAVHSHDGVYPKKYVQAVGDNSKTTIDVTHNLGTRDVVVQLRQTVAPFEQVLCDVEMKTEAIVTLKFAKAPTASEYTVTIVG